MSRDRKRMKRALLTKLARAHRTETQGAGQGRKTLQGWVWTTKYDLWKAWDEQQRTQRATQADNALLLSGTDDGSSRVTPE